MLQKVLIVLACWTRADGNTTYLRFSATGRERTILDRAPPHPPLLELRATTWFSLPPGSLSYLPRHSDVACLDFVLAPLPYALPGGEPCIHVHIGMPLFFRLHCPNRGAVIGCFFLSILIWCGFPHVTHGMLARRSTLFLPQKPSHLTSKLVFLSKCRRSSKRI